MSLNESIRTDNLNFDKVLRKQFPEVKNSDLPDIIVSQFDKLKDLERLNKDSKRAAKSSRRMAKEAKDKTIGWFNKKARIEDLQSVNLELAQAVQTLTDTQEVSFRHQNELAQISKYLFGLGVSNISANRSVVRELELRLKGASEEELSELARQELTSVVKQLKAQEDVIKKQEKFTRRLNRQDGDITELFDKDREINEKVELQSDKFKAEIKKINENLMWSGKEFENRIEKLSDNFNLEISGSNFKILKVKNEVKSLAHTANKRAEKIEQNFKSELDSNKLSMEESDKSFSKVLKSQKIKINVLGAFLILNIIVLIILAFFTLKA